MQHSCIARFFVGQWCGMRHTENSWLHNKGGAHLQGLHNSKMPTKHTTLCSVQHQRHGIWGIIKNFEHADTAELQRDNPYSPS